VPTGQRHAGLAGRIDLKRTLTDWLLSRIDEQGAQEAARMACRADEALGGVRGWYAEG